MKRYLLAVSVVLFVLLASDSQAQGCFGPGCGGGGTSTITSGDATSGFTANTLIRNGSNALASGPKFLSGDLSLELGVNRCVDSGANDTYTCNLAGGSLAAYSAGTQIILRANTANTGTATLAVDGLSAITITRRDDSTLQTGDIAAGDYVPLVYDGNTFRMARGLSDLPAYFGGGVAVANVSGLEISMAGTYGFDLFTPSVGWYSVVNSTNAYWTSASLFSMVSGACVGWSSSATDGFGTNVTLCRHASGVMRSGTSATTISGFMGGGTAVASATAMPLPTGRVFHVTGTTTITSITSTNFVSGAVITLIFDDVLTFTDGSNLKLEGDFVTTADDTITLVYDGTNWYEIGRRII